MALDTTADTPDDSDLDAVGEQMSPLQALLGGAGFTTVTPEGKAKATEVFGDLYSKRTAYDTAENAAYDEYETKAAEAREILKRAREVLAAKKTPSTRWLELAKGFGAPTRTGAFGESISNYATARIPGKQQEQAWEETRDKDVLGMDQGVNTIDQNLALQRLRLQAARKGSDDKLMIEAMKIMGKPVPNGKTPPRTTQDRAAAALDAAYVKDYLDFNQQGAANASSDIEALTAANRTLKGLKYDPKTGKDVPGVQSDTISGPFVGILPKMVRDIILPKSSETQENIESVAQKSMRVIMGPQFTENEGVRLLARVYNPLLEEHVNARRVSRLLQQLQRAYAQKVAAAKYFEQNGTLQHYKGKTSWTMSDFDPDVPDGRSPLDAVKSELGAVTGSTPPGNTRKPVTEGIKPDLEWEWGEPAKEAAFAEGGLVGTTPDGRSIFKMPDGKTMGAPKGVTYEQAVERWKMLSGSADTPTIPGLPPQEIPDRDDPDPGAPPLPDPTAPNPDPQMMADPQVPPPDMGDRMIGGIPASVAGAGAGALVGATASVAAPRIAGALQAPVRGVANRIRPGSMQPYGESPAEKRLLSLMQEKGITPSGVAGQVRGMQKQGIPAMAMDAGDPTMRTLAESGLAQSGLPNATEALKRLRDRNAGQASRTADQVNTALKPDEYFSKLDELTDNMYKNAKPLYDAAYAANPKVKSKVLPALLNTPDGKKAVKNALRLMRNQGKQIGKADAMGMVTAPSLEFLDNVKRGFDQLIATEEGAGASRQSTPLGKSMRDLRGQLLTELDTATKPSKGDSLYAKARAEYAGDLEVRDALQSGREEFDKMAPAELKKKFDALSFSEKDAFRTGVAQRLFESIDKPTRETNAAQKIIGSGGNRKKLEALFDTPKQAELYTTALQKESELYDASKGTITKAELGQAQHVEPAPGRLRKITKYIPRLGIGSVPMWALQAIRVNSDGDEKHMDELVKHLKAATPDELADLSKLDKKLGRRIARTGRAGKAAKIGAGVGAAGAMLEAAMGEGDDAE